MPENVALTKNKQKSFSKSVEKTKDKIKKGDIKIQAKSPRRFNKGVIYLSNIPHGFYEKELKSYFDQFGDVLKVRVARSKKTGNSKGHAFIQFKEQAVAKIAAETMNNYLMGKRLLKSQLLPYDKKTKALFKKPNFSKEHYPTKVRRLRFKKSFNAAITEDTLKKSTKKALKHIKNIKDKLKEAGIEYDFTPANMPKAIPEIKEVEDDFDDSSSEDIIFTPPEKMNSSSEEAVIKTDANNKRKSNKKETNVSPKKVKKNASVVSIVNKSTKEMKQQVKEAKNKNKFELTSKENNVNNTNDSLKKEKQKKNKNNLENKSLNEISKKENKKVKKEKKHKNKDSSNSASADNSNNENKENMKKSPKRKQKIVENTENIINENTENIKKSPKYKQKKIENTENSINENKENNKKEAKQKKGDKKIKKLNESIDEIKSSVAQGPILKKKKNKVNVEGITKKSKKVQKISDKKASLIKGLIQTNDQVKTVKKIEKKKKKTKINQS